MHMRLPRLLTPSSGEEARLNPAYLSLSLSLWDLSTAQMSLPEGEPTIRVRDLVEVFSQSGSLGYFRASSVATRCGESQEVYLEHTVVTLDDDLTDKEKTLTGSMKSIIKAILGYQTVPRWTLGDVEASGSGLELKVDRTSLRSALVQAVKLQDGYGIFYEQNNEKWKIHIRKLPTSPSCECRLLRNASDVEIMIDDHDLCTKVYSPELPNGYLQVDTSEWGVVCHNLNIPAGATDAQATKCAKDYLKAHKEPTVSVRVDAVELAELTGEEWDAFTLGDMCRVALPEWGITQNKQIITMDYNDIIYSPTKVRLTLSKPERRIEEVTVNNRRGAGGASKQANEAEQGLIIANDNITFITADLETAFLRIDKAEKAITLKADLIDLQGYVTMDRFNAEFAELNSLLSGAAVISFAKFNAIQIDNTHINSVKWHNININGTTYSLLGAP